MKIDRRTFIKTLGHGAILLTGLTGCEEIIITPKNAGTQLRFATPEDQWYYQSGQGTAIAQAPQTSLTQWQCPIVSPDGQTLITLDANTLTSFERISYWKTMRCVFGATHGGPLKLLTYNAIFEGVSLDAIFKTLDIPQTTRRVRFFSEDGFTNNLLLSRIKAPEPLPVLLATHQNGRPLKVAHGAPVRLIVPEMCGYKNIKWLSRIELSEQDRPFGRYETELFAEQSVGKTLAEHIDQRGWLPLSSNLTTPPTESGATLPGPDITLSGVCTSGAGTISKIEISLDDQPFEVVNIPNKATLLETVPDDLRALDAQTLQANDPWPTPGIWVPWQHTFSGLTPGEHQVIVRATDSTGQRQNDEDQRPIFYSQIRAKFQIV